MQQRKKLFLNLFFRCFTKCNVKSLPRNLLASIKKKGKSRTNNFISFPFPTSNRARSPSWPFLDSALLLNFQLSHTRHLRAQLKLKSHGWKFTFISRTFAQKKTHKFSTPSKWSKNYSIKKLSHWLQLKPYPDYARLKWW